MDAAARCSASNRAVAGVVAGGAFEVEPDGDEVLGHQLAGLGDYWSPDFGVGRPVSCLLPEPPHAWFPEVKRHAPHCTSERTARGDGRATPRGDGNGVQVDEQIVRLAENSLGERSLASYAVGDDAIFLRTEKNLYRIQAESR